MLNRDFLLLVLDRLNVEYDAALPGQLRKEWLGLAGGWSASATIPRPWPDCAGVECD